MPRRHKSLRPQQNPCVPRNSLPLARPASVQTSLLTPKARRSVGVEPCRAPDALKPSLKLFCQCCAGWPGPVSSPPSSLSANNSRLGSRLSPCLAKAPANRSRRWRIVASTFRVPVFLRALAGTYLERKSQPATFTVVCVLCVFFPFILDIKFVGRTSRGHTGGRPHRISQPPSFCCACPNFSRGKGSAIPFPRRP